MEQMAVVKSVQSNGMAQVSVRRTTACAHDCDKCAGCEQLNTRMENTVLAYNDAQASPGDLVRLQSENAISTIVRLSSTRQSHMLFVVTQSSPSMSRRLDHVCHRLARKDAMDTPPSVAPRNTQSSKTRLSQFMCMTSCTAKSASSTAARPIHSFHSPVNIGGTTASSTASARFIYITSVI